MAEPRARIAIVHLDESCLGNGREGASPGGGAALVEVRTAKGIERWDFFVHSPDTTNNKMALAGAIGILQLLARKGNRLRLLLVSDSEYLVRGVREWLPGWIARGWKRKGGEIENLELWNALSQSLALHEVQLAWVRGHQGHPKNEYVNDLAIQAARTQQTSHGIVPSEFADWLARKRAPAAGKPVGAAVGKYTDYDPDAAFTALEERLRRGERIPLDLDAGGRPDG